MLPFSAGLRMPCRYGVVVHGFVVIPATIDDTYGDVITPDRHRYAAFDAPPWPDWKLDYLGTFPMNADRHSIASLTFPMHTNT
jgi:hypothetical protein